jgi:transcriptional regulator with XRE-family HTH domain
MDSTADIIKRLRAAGLSQSEIKRRTGIPQPRLSRWEAGKAPDSVDDALKLAKLDAEVSQGAVAAPPPDTPTEDRRAGADRRERDVPIAFGNRRHHVRRADDVRVAGQGV